MRVEFTQPLYLPANRAFITGVWDKHDKQLEKRIEQERLNRITPIVHDMFWDSTAKRSIIRTYCDVDTYEDQLYRALIV